MKKVVFVGSVDSSDRALKTLIEQDVEIKLVCSLDPGCAANVSDYCPVHKTAESTGIPYVLFKDINDAETVNEIRAVSPDFIFVVGLSQIVKKEILDIPKEYSVGFHPTPIPHNRGRAALPWEILLGEKESSVTFFRLDEGMDSGDVLFREPYIIDENDYVTDVYEKVLCAMSEGLRKNVRLLLGGKIEPQKQDESDASYLLVRRPYDGVLDWGKPTNEILKVIRATSHPYPGAYSYVRGKKLKIFRAEPWELDKRYVGYNGQIAEIDAGNNLIVLTDDGALKVTEYEVEDNARVYAGSRLIGAYDAGIHGI